MCAAALQAKSARNIGRSIMTAGRMNVNESIVRSFAKSTVAVETGFLVAGVTVAITAAVQTLVIVMNWAIG